MPRQKRLNKSRGIQPLPQLPPTRADRSLKAQTHWGLDIKSPTMMPEQPPKPGYSALRQHRWSAAGIEYFVTLNLERPASGLSDSALLEVITQQFVRLETEAAWSLRTWVVMPDHIHLLFTLGTQLSLSESLRLLKGRLSPALRKQRLNWQDGYYEHRLRADDDRLPIFLYIFLNPYRAHLISTTETWPGYYCSSDDQIWFAPLTDSDLPFPEWLQ